MRDWIFRERDSPSCAIRAARKLPSPILLTLPTDVPRSLRCNTQDSMRGSPQSDLAARVDYQRSAVGKMRVDQFLRAQDIRGEENVERREALNLGMAIATGTVARG